MIVQKCADTSNSPEGEFDLWVMFYTCMIYHLIMVSQ